MLKLKLFLFSFLLALSFPLFAQIPSLPADLTGLKSSDITNEQLNQIAGYLQQNNITTEQAYNLLTSRGMIATEANTLKSRLERVRGVQFRNNAAPDSTQLNQQNRYSTNSNGPSDTTNPNNTVKNLNPKKIFGLEIFNNGVLSFEPNLSIATPVGYIVGPNDEINVNIYGYQEAKYTLKVSPEGDINIPYVGIVYVAGLTIEQATEKIKNRLSVSGYSNIKTGLTKVNVSVGRIRSIKVTVLGEVRTPGTYTLPSLATAFNALYLSGGPNDIGSMRNIEIIRNGRVVDNLDIYDFLVRGDQKGNINLQDQDVVRIPAYKVRVSLEGEVKRSGLFEMKTNESLQDLLDFAGGFSDSAYTASVTAYKVTDKENRIVDINQSDYSNYIPNRSEAFVVKKIIGRFINRVSIGGAVYLPGDYELTDGMTVKDLINKAQGLKQDAYNARGIITRSREDLTPEFVSFSPLEVLKNGANDLLLKPDDRITITSVSDLKENTNVSITGEVRNTGVFTYVENMSLKDLILLAGGFTDAAIPQRIEVARRIKKDSFDIRDMAVAEVFDITSLEDLDTKGGDIKLRAYDAVVVRKNPAYQRQVSIRVEGEVVFPGTYVIKNKVERVSDVIRRAGGLTLQAYNSGGYITRKNNKTVINQVNATKINRIQETLNDTTQHLEEEIERTVDQIAINLNKIIASPGSREDIMLEEGDVVTIPKEKMDVRISGQVLFPTRVVYQENLELKDYLGRAGGLTDNARRAKIYVLYPNGNAAKTSHFLFFKSYPRVTPGAEVIVPKKHEVERRRLTTGEIIGITTAITSLAGILLSVIINLRK